MLYYYISQKTYRSHQYIPSIYRPHKNISFPSKNRKVVNRLKSVEEAKAEYMLLLFLQFFDDNQTCLR